MWITLKTVLNTWWARTFRLEVKTERFRFLSVMKYNLSYQTNVIKCKCKKTMNRVGVEPISADHLWKWVNCFKSVFLYQLLLRLWISTKTWLIPVLWETDNFLHFLLPSSCTVIETAAFRSFDRNKRGTYSLAVEGMAVDKYPALDQIAP